MDINEAKDIVQDCLTQQGPSDKISTDDLKTAMNTVLDYSDSIRQFVAEGSKPIYPTDTTEAPTANIIYRAMEAGTYSNLKLANGSAAPDITVSAEDMKSVYVELVYNASTDSWSKELIEADLTAANPTPGLEELFAPESELGTFTLSSTANATFVLVKPITFNMTEFKVQAIIAGTIRFAAFSRVGTTTTRLRFVDKVMTVGINTVNLVLNTGEYLGWFHNNTTLLGRIGHKTIPDVYTYQLFTGVEVTGATHTGYPTGNNVWFAISTGYARTFADKTSQLSGSVYDMSSDIEDNIKPDIASLQSGLETTPGLEEMFAPESELGSFTGGTSFSGTVVMLVPAPFNMDSIKVQCTTVGTVRFAAFTRTSTTTTRQRYVDAVLTVGINEVPLVVNTGEYIGIYENTTTLTGRIGQKVIPGVYTYQLFNGIDVTSATHTGYPTGNNAWLAISTGYARTFADNLTVLDNKVSSVILKPYPSNIYFNSSALFGSISRFNKYLTVIGVIGDSLTGNPLGGALPIGMDEGFAMRPYRLTFNNWVRRMYDLLCWNKPQHRRLDHAGWTKTGTWTAEATTNIWEPVYNNEVYHRTATAGATADFVVPSGMEHFALIVAEMNGRASVDFTLNGGSISAYGPSSYNTSFANVGHTGNPYKILQWNNLPAGNNTIRLTKDGTSNPLYVWGGFYWSGNTVFFINIAHGGHTLGDLLSQHWQDEYLRNNFDATILQLTEMNDVRVNAIDTSKANLNTMLDVISLKDCLVTSCNILGKDPVDNDPNYWDLYPGQNLFNDAFKKIVLDRGLPFIDLYRGFELSTLQTGGTLANGDAGLLYTTDGMHGNEKGVNIWFDVLKPILKRTPIYQ